MAWLMFLLPLLLPTGSLVIPNLVDGEYKYEKSIVERFYKFVEKFGSKGADYKTFRDNLIIMDLLNQLAESNLCCSPKLEISEKADKKDFVEMRMSSYMGELFRNYKRNFNKRYNNWMDEDQHFLTFCENLGAIIQNNVEHLQNPEHSMILGINQFTDLKPNQVARGLIN